MWQYIDDNVTMAVTVSIIFDLLFIFDFIPKLNPHTPVAQNIADDVVFNVSKVKVSSFF